MNHNTGNNIDDAHKCNIERKKPDMKEYDFTCIKSKTDKTNLFKTWDVEYPSQEKVVTRRGMRKLLEF